jgi:hypothetical protein
MSNSRRNIRIDKKKRAIEALGISPDALGILHSLAQEDPGMPLRCYIRGKLKLILAGNPERAEELRVDVDEILVLLKEHQLRKERLLDAKKAPKIPPFEVPAPFADQFRWAFKITKIGEIKWQLLE